MLIFYDMAAVASRQINSDLSGRLKCAASILGPLSEGAVSKADWGSVVAVVGHSLRHGLRRATSLKEGGRLQCKFYQTVKLKFDALRKSNTASYAKLAVVYFMWFACFCGFPEFAGSMSKGHRPATGRLQ